MNGNRLVCITPARIPYRANLVLDRGYFPVSSKHGGPRLIGKSDYWILDGLYNTAGTKEVTTVLLHSKTELHLD